MTDHPEQQSGEAPSPGQTSRPGTVPQPGQSPPPAQMPPPAPTPQPGESPPADDQSSTPPPNSTIDDEPPDGPDSVPPLTAFAWRNHLVRPLQGRMLAGVCGALGRATNTDPVLWRVLIAVLSVFGGIGVLAYLLGWLLLPADGDTASPVEALMGRGRSGTSPVMTVIGGVVALLSLGVFFSEPLRPGPFGVILLGAVVIILLRDKRGRVMTHSSPPAAAPTGPPPVAPVPPFAPFAPHGPFAPSTYPSDPRSAGPARPPIVAATRPPVRQRSRLGRLTLSMAILALGGLAVFDLTGAAVPAAGYIAIALTTIGLGLVVGGWFGRSRGLIPLGIALALVLGLAGFFDQQDEGWWRSGATSWAPTTIEQLRADYTQDVGAIRLDLTAIDFSQASAPIDLGVRLDVGSMEIIVPNDVDVTIDANVDIGNADVFGQSWGGLGQDARTITDSGADGPGGGTLRIIARVDLGNLEVRR